MPISRQHYFFVFAAIFAAFNIRILSIYMKKSPIVKNDNKQPRSKDQSLPPCQKLTTHEQKMPLSERNEEASNNFILLTEHCSKLESVANSIRDLQKDNNNITISDPKLLELRVDGKNAYAAILNTLPKEIAFLQNASDNMPFFYPTLQYIKNQIFALIKWTQNDIELIDKYMKNQRSTVESITNQASQLDEDKDYDKLYELSTKRQSLEKAIGTYQKERVVMEESKQPLKLFLENIHHILNEHREQLQQHYSVQPNITTNTNFNQPNLPTKEQPFKGRFFVGLGNGEEIDKLLIKGLDAEIKEVSNQINKL
jgi:hypothetical protein